MILDEFRSESGFPFDRYFEFPTQYAAATQYWLRVLRSVPGFAEEAWKPRERPVEIKEDMYLGKVVDILSIGLRKEINLQTSSILGDANVLFNENQGCSEAEYQRQKDLLGQDFELDEGALQGMSYQDALQEAEYELRHNPVKAWVEDAVHWQPGPSAAEGGFEVGIERLVLTSVISEQAEAKAVRALGLFLQEGPALERVNSVFSPDEEQ